MKSNFYIFALWVLFGVKVAVAIPIPLDADVSHKWTLQSVAGRIRAGVSKDQAIQNVNTAVTDAHAQVLSMEKVLQNQQHPGRHEILQKSFGENYHDHMPAIERGVERLKQGHIQVTNVFGNDKHTIGETITHRDAKKEVHTGFTFHKNLGREARAGNIVHEASHAILGTEDYHVHNAHLEGPHKLEEIGLREAKSGRHPAGAVKVGYAWSKDYKHVVDNHHNPTMNADSWKTFGFHAHHGLEHKLPEGKTLERSTSHDSTHSTGSHHNVPSGSGGAKAHGHGFADVAAAIHPPTAGILARHKRDRKSVV